MSAVHSYRGPKASLILDRKYEASNSKSPDPEVKQSFGGWFAHKGRPFHTNIITGVSPKEGNFEVGVHLNGVYSIDADPADKDRSAKRDCRLVIIPTTIEPTGGSAPSIFS